MSQEVFIIEALRTPVGKAPKGVFKDVLPDDLLAHCIAAICERQPRVDWQQLGDVVIGCAMPEAEQGMNIARIASLIGGLPDSVPAMTLNRFCSSGVQSIATACQQIAQGQMAMAFAGGVESMSKVPMGGNKYTVNPKVFDNEQIAIAYGMGITAENVAKQWGISREAQDEFAVESHRRAIKAQKNGAFNDEIVPFTVHSRKIDSQSQSIIETDTPISADQGPRADTSMEAVSKLKPVFAAKGSVTAGNSSQMSDGAGLVFLANKATVDRYQLTPIGRLLSYQVAGVPPEIMGIGPVKAIPMALEQANLTIEQLDWIELNEAFAAQSLAVINELNLPRDKVNPNGGAIALGHPLGATGAIRTATLLHGLKKQKGRYGMVTMCIGTGMGAAAIFERL